MAIAFVECANPDSFHPLNIYLPPQTRSIDQHTNRARLHERKQRTLATRTRSDFPWSYSCCFEACIDCVPMPHARSMERVRVPRSDVLTSSCAVVRPQCACSSSYTLRCSLHSTKTWILCAMDGFQDGRTKMAERGSSIGCRIAGSLSYQSRFLGSQLVHKCCSRCETCI